MSNRNAVIEDIDIKNPFPGLRPFGVEESHLYFGRSKQSKAVSKLLHSNQFAAVIGASGSGKSSLAYCGVVPEFFNGLNTSGCVISFRPGNDPIRNMVDAFSKIFPGKVSAVDSVGLVETKKSLEAWISEHEFKDQTFLLVIDQFEELFRYNKNNDSEARSRVSRFIELIVEAVLKSEKKILVMLTMRSDFVGECSAFQSLTDLINKSNYLIPHMGRGDYKEAIIGPLKLREISIEENLLDQLLEEVGKDSDQLPVLQHAMMRTFNYWKMQNKPEKAMSIGDYDAIGTMHKALSQHANEAYDELNDDQRQICEKLFKTITEKSGDNRGIRRPTTIKRISEIAQCKPEEVIEVANKFRSNGRTFLTPYQPAKLLPGTIVDVSHESLMRIWDRLSLWVDEEAASVQMYKRLIDASALYQAGRTGLWRPPDLQLALNWKEKQKPSLAWATQYYPAFERSMLYLNTSEAEYKKEEENKIKLQKRRLRVTRTFALILGGIAIVAMGLFLWTRDLTRQAEAARDNAILQEQLALEAKNEAIASAEEARAQRQIALEKTDIANQQTEIASEQTIKAETNLTMAQRQARIASDNYKEAQRLARIASQNEKTALEERQRAENASEESFQRRLVAIAKSISIKLLQVDDDPDLQALLAFQAYKYNMENNGNRYDADIYAGLYTALKNNTSRIYNVYSGQNYSVRAVEWIKSKDGFLSADSEGRILYMSGDFANSRSNSIIANTNQVNEDLALSPDETQLACATDGNGIFIYSVAKPDNFYNLTGGHNGKVKKIAYHNSGQKIISIGTDNSIVEWNLASKEAREFSKLTSRPTSLAISNFTNKFVVGTRDGKVYEYDWDTSGSGRLLYSADNSVLAVTYSPDDAAVVIGTMDGIVKFINRTSASAGITIRGPEARVTDLKFSFNGKYLAAASHDGNVYLWETSDWNNEPVVVDDNKGFVLALCFSGNSNYFYSGSTEAPRLIGRPVESSLMVDNFCDLVNRNLTQAEWDNYIGEDIEYQKTCPGK